MHSNLMIDHHDDGIRGRYRVLIAPGVEGEMTYFYRAPDVIVVDHTHVPRAYEGQGIALALVQRGVADAREKGLRIVPQCRYVAAQFQRHRDWVDVLA